MALSVLIPNYQRDVRQLVFALHKQLVFSGIPFEILVAEDDPNPSPIHENNTLIQQLEHVTYHVNPKNLGRSANRNQLVSMALYDHLLFMDGDALVMDGQYISNFIPYLGNTIPIVHGGVAYAPLHPGKEKLLHWKNGTAREMRPAETRNETPEASFTFFNTLITKKTLLENPLDESITGYGHEDTVWGHVVYTQGIPIFHIENYLLHDGLEPNAVFLDKIAISVKNLKKLHSEKQVKIDSKLLKTIQKIERNGIVQRLCEPILKALFTPLNHWLIQFPDSPLILLDIYKLSAWYTNGL